MLLTEDDSVKSLIANLTTQLSEWLEAKKSRRIVLVLMSKATSDVPVRWNFSIETDDEEVTKDCFGDNEVLERWNKQS